MGLGHLEPGCALFDNSVQLDPTYVAAYVGQAKCAYYKKNIDKARALIAKAKSVDSKDIQPWLLEGDSEGQLGDAKAAYAAYAQALSLEPRNMAAITGHAYTALKLHDTAGAKQDIDKARKQYRDSIPVKYLEGLLALSEGKLEVARDKAQDILRASPEHTGAQMLLGSASYGLKDYEIARSSLSKVIEQQPGNLGARKLLANLMIKHGQGKQALSVIRPALIQTSQ